MSNTIISVENLSKHYILSHKKDSSNKQKYKTIRDTLVEGVNSIGQRLITPSNKRDFNPKKEEFWALKDVSFEIKQGDRVWIV